MPHRPSADSAFYDAPDLYDAVHEPDSAKEAALIIDLFRAFGNGGRDVLEPACGTGRLLARLAKKGFRCTGCDVSAKALSYARKKRPGISFIKEDMRKFCRLKSFDLAFNLLGTFRHLMNDRDALAHLRCVANSLRKGGIYIVQLDLADYDHAADDEETWTGKLGGKKVEHVMMSLAPDRRRRRERIINFLTHGTRVLKSEYDLRSYDLEQWQDVVRKSSMRIIHASLFPKEGPGIRDGVFVIKSARI